AVILASRASILARLARQGDHHFESTKAIFSNPSRDYLTCDNQLKRPRSALSPEPIKIALCHDRVRNNLHISPKNMKPTSSIRGALLRSAFATSIAFIPSARAATVYWDVNGPVDGSGNGGGCWESSNWN